MWKIKHFKVLFGGLQSSCQWKLIILWVWNLIKLIGVFFIYRTLLLSLFFPSKKHTRKILVGKSPPVCFPQFPWVQESEWVFTSELRCSSPFRTFFYVVFCRQAWNHSVWALSICAFMLRILGQSTLLSTNWYFLSFSRGFSLGSAL